MNRVSIVLPNYNGLELLQQFLPRVVEAVGDAEVIIADDASTDGSVEWLRAFGYGVKVVECPAHRGFAATVNTGVDAAKGDIVVLLNTDVVPEKGFLAPLTKPFADERVFAVGCLEKSHEAAGVVERGRGKARWQKGFFIHWKGEPRGHDTAWVSGGSAAFRRRMWRELGGMDELYNPFYWEDIDLSYRAKKAGYLVLFEPKSIVHHYHDRGSIRKAFSPQYVKTVAYRNQFIFIWKNTADPGILREHLLWLPVRKLQALLRGDWAFLLGLFRAASMLPAILSKRAQQQHHWRMNDSDIPL